jgi:hypothetical protein
MLQIYNAAGCLCCRLPTRGDTALPTVSERGSQLQCCRLPMLHAPNNAAVLQAPYAAMLHASNTWRRRTRPHCKLLPNETTSCNAAGSLCCNAAGCLCFNAAASQLYAAMLPAAYTVMLQAVNTWRYRTASCFRARLPAALQPGLYAAMLHAPNNAAGCLCCYVADFQLPTCRLLLA